MIAMYAYYWDAIKAEWCQKVCGLFMTIFLLVIAIFFLSSFAAPYSNYTKFYYLRYPDTMGIMGGALFGFFLTWVLLPPEVGSLSRASRRELCLFITGLICSIGLLAIAIGVFAGAEPKVWWYIQTE